MQKFIMGKNTPEQNEDSLLSYLNDVNRDGMSELIEYLEGSDYFTAPASTKYHGNYKGGLSEHHLNVTLMLLEEMSLWEKPLSTESSIICGALHDLCKIGYYNKTDKGYETVKGVKGHATISIDRINNFIELTQTESEVILYHMGMFGAYSFTKEYEAYSMYKAMKTNQYIQIFAAIDMAESRRIH